MRPLGQQRQTVPAAHPRACHRFVAGLKPYEQTISVDFIAAGDGVRMVTTIEPMHSAEFTQTSIKVFTNQLNILEGRFH
jgi:hypothetical protein